MLSRSTGKFLRSTYVIRRAATSCRRSFASSSRLSTLARYDVEDDFADDEEGYNYYNSSYHTETTTPSSSTIDWDTRLSHYASQTPTSVSLDWLMRTGDCDYTLAEFLRQELPIRLAHRITDVDSCWQLRHTPALQGVRKLYLDSLRQLVNDFPHPVMGAQEEERFANVLTGLYQKHSGVLVDMARGAYQWREELRSQRKEEGEEEDTFAAQHECHAFLDRFYLSRTGIRFLAGQYLAARQPPPPRTIAGDHQSYVGMICRTTRPLTCVQQAIADASLLCRRTYGRSPRVEIVSSTNETFPYIPTYLHYILLELLKNALRATMDAHADKAVIPPVQVVLADGAENEDVVIKIADQGGGIRRSQVDKIWSYLYTTASPQVQKSFVGSDSKVADHTTAPLAGLGYGLPIARGYCRYFGGDLDLMSLEGYGTDAFVHLKRLGNSREPVPV